MSDSYARLWAQMIESSQEMLANFNPAAGAAKIGGFDRMFPTMTSDLMEMWFGKTFNREGLDAKTRLLVVLGAIVAQGATAEPQLKVTVRHALEAGASQREIAEVIWQMSMFGGLPAMQKALELAQSVFDEKKDG